MTRGSNTDSFTFGNASELCERSEHPRLQKTGNVGRRVHEGKSAQAAARLAEDNNLNSACSVKTTLESIVKRDRSMPFCASHRSVSQTGSALVQGCGCQEIPTQIDDGDTPVILPLCWRSRVYSINRFEHCPLERRMFNALTIAAAHWKQLLGVMKPL